MQHIRKMTGILLVTALFGIPAAHAMPITFEFAGTIADVDDPQGLLNGSILMGTAFRGSYTFEPTHDDYPDNEELGWYAFALSPESAFRLHIGDYDITAPLDHISVLNANADSYGVSTTLFSLGSVQAQLGLGLDAPNAQFFSSDMLPLVPPDMNLAFKTGLSFRAPGSPTSLFVVQGTITSLTPEPASAALLFAGMSLGLLRRQNRRIQDNNQ